MRKSKYTDEQAPAQPTTVLAPELCLRERNGFLGVAGEDLHLGWQPHRMPELADNAQDIAIDIIHLIGRQALVTQLAEIDVLADPAETEEGRVVAGDVLLVGTAHRFEVQAKAAIGFEADEDRLMDHQFQQVVVPQTVSRADEP